MIWRVAICLLGIPLPAFALSCAPWGVENAIQELRTSPEQGAVYLGRLSFDQKAFPIVDWSKQQDVAPVTQIPAKLTTLANFSQLRDGFGTGGEDLDITLEVRCAGPWCPKPPYGEALVFVLQSAAGLTTWTGPCGGLIFSEPTQPMINRLKACLADGATCARDEY